MEQQRALVEERVSENHFVRRTTWAVLVCILYLGLFALSIIQYHYTRKLVWVVPALWVPTALCFIVSVVKTAALPNRISIIGDTLTYEGAGGSMEFRVSSIRAASWHYFRPSSLAPVLRPMVVYSPDHLRLQGLCLTLVDAKGEEQILPLVGFPIQAMLHALRRRSAPVPVMVFTRYIGLGARECELVFEPSGTIGEDATSTIVVKDAEKDGSVPVRFELVDPAEGFDPKLLLKSAAWSGPRSIHLGTRFKLGKHHYFFEPIRANFLFS